MNKTNKPSTNSNALSTEIIAAYQSAVDLAIYEGGLAWQATSVYIQFSILLIAGAIFPSFVGTINPQILSLAGLILSFVGVGSTLAWWSMIGRSRTYYQYWILSARELESQLSEPIQTLTRGAKFAEGDNVVVDSTSIKFRLFERIKMRTNFSLIYATFLLSFIVIMIINFLRVIKAF